MSVLSEDDNDEVCVEMPTWMNERDFQNVAYNCCGLVSVRKFGMEHSRCSGSEDDEKRINVSVQKCRECGLYCGDVVAYICHMEKDHLALSCHVCALCRNIYVTSVALHCHISNYHGNLDLAKRDYKRKYELRT